ncbi:conserved hypothetical protein [Culex quinquefasciatus]|uniref:DH domain-containing protein n=1 Tax=Culex quinquefasciatus TaxID=7176 RepID=B0WT27_CULQU|nr:conserved hypothetical protein [Culex quinquefasciatus]|eukprot:XP_001870789.1 conserved hypothetical protein [Culex quinquefasciatus]
MMCRDWEQRQKAIPEADYIQLGTLRYGVRLSNPNLLNLGAPPNAAHGANGSNGVKQHSQTPPTGSSVPPSVGGGASSSGNSSNSVGSNKSCCCIGSGGEIEMPWNSSYARTRLPVPNSLCPNIAEEAALEDFIFIDSSDISTTSEDIITVINEEDYHDFHKFPSVPKIECALVENLYQSVCDSRRIPNSCSSDELSSVCSGSPYGQMLEAEMKKPSKVHYNEILEELSRHESRTASSPSKLAELGIPDSTPQTSPSKRHLGHIEQRSTDSDKSEKATNKLETKKFSLDSHLSDSHDKHAKRNSSGASDKHPKRSLDDTRLAQPSRTPSERSFVLNTPDTPKGLVASPELLAELLKGSSEKLVTEQLTGATSPNNGSNALPTAVLKCLDTRTHVVVELFNTEKSYVESLQTIVLKYLNQLKSSENAGLVDNQTVDEIFFMVPAILNIHERFLEELRRRLDAWDPLQKIGDAFVDVFSRPVILDTYTSFVNNWNRAKDAIRTTRQKCPAFARFLEAMAREHKVHDILMFLNCKEKEALENGQRETALRELEGVIEGMSDLVTPERAFLLFDLVSMPSGQTRKERGFFLFNDLLVITSIKRRSGTIRKTNM